MEKPHKTSGSSKGHRDTGTSMIFFAGMAPLMVGVLFLYAVEPAPGITVQYDNDNWIEPVGSMTYLVIIAPIVKWILL